MPTNCAGQRYWWRNRLGARTGAGGCTEIWAMGTAQHLEAMPGSGGQ